MWIAGVRIVGRRGSGDVRRRLRALHAEPAALNSTMAVGLRFYSEEISTMLSTTKTMSTIRYAMGFVAIAGATMAVGATAEARSVSAFTGQPQNPNDYTCFTNSGGTVSNVCASTRRFCAALVVDDASHDPQVTVFAPDIGHNIICFGQTVNPDGSPFSNTKHFSPTHFGVTQTLDLGSVTVPDAGALWVCCDVAPGATIDTFNY
jgi:hypothetical protein